MFNTNIVTMPEIHCPKQGWLSHASTLLLGKEKIWYFLLQNTSKKWYYSQFFWDKGVEERLNSPSVLFSSKHHPTAACLLVSEDVSRRLELVGAAILTLLAASWLLCYLKMDF